MRRGAALLPGTGGKKFLLRMCIPEQLIHSSIPSHKCILEDIFRLDSLEWRLTDVCGLTLNQNLSLSQLDKWKGGVCPEVWPVIGDTQNWLGFTYKAPRFLSLSQSHQMVVEKTPKSGYIIAC